MTYDYDNSGALATVYDSETDRTTTYYYDFTDRMMKYVESGDNYSHSVGYEYDKINNLTALVETINGVKHTTSYDYDKDNRITSVTSDGMTKSYTYDGYGRVTQRITKRGDTTVLTETLTYWDNANGAPTSQVKTHRTQSAGYDVTNSYTYDGNGNILSVSDGTYTTTYAYDSANQLIREDNQKRNKSKRQFYPHIVCAADGDPSAAKEYFHFTRQSLGALHWCRFWIASGCMLVTFSFYAYLTTNYI